MSIKNSTNIDFPVLKRIASLYDVEIVRGWQKTLAEKMRIKGGNAVVSAWKKRGVPGEAIANVALEKGVSKEWLKTGEGEPYTRPTPDPPQQTKEQTTGYSNQPLNDEELHLIKLYRKLHPAEKEKVIEIAELYCTTKELRRNVGGGSDLKESNSK